FLEASSLDGLWYWDLENPEHEWMSDRFWQTLGFDPDSRPHLASSWKDLIFPEDLRLAQANFEAHCADPEHPYDQVVRYRDSAGETVWIRCRGLAIRDSIGKPVRMLGAHVNITEHKRAEALARQQIRFLQSVLDATPNGLLVVDGQGRVRMSNLPARSLLGYTPEVLEGLGVEEIFPEDFARLRYETDHLCRESEGPEQEAVPISLETSCRDRLGERVPVEVTLGAVPIEDSAHAQISILDIRQRIAAERAERDLTERLERANRQLEKSNVELENYAFIVSHDLREPLRGISSFLSLLREEYAPQLDDNARTYIDFAVSGAERLQEMVLSILEYSQLESPRHSATTFDVAEALGTAVDALYVQLEESDARLQLPTEAVPITGDFEQITLVFQNLISNSLKFVEGEIPNISVSFTTRPGSDLPGDLEPGEKYCVAEVRDRGIGIAPEDHEKIFGMFRRLHARNDYEGTGIGLTACLKIISLHQGTMWLDSSLGSGASFSFALPLA
ncbi:MAG: ATP-binding protein, partial [Acidobacteriota bacterium]